MRTRLLLPIAALIFVLTLAVLATAPLGAAEAKLEGVWKAVEYTASGSTNTNPQPIIIIYTKGHYSFIGVQGEKPRPALPAQNATDAQRVAAWAPFNASVGTYELHGNTLTAHTIVGKRPEPPGSITTWDVRIEGNTLWIAVKAVNNNPAASQYSFKLTRVE
jgi:hypothetical protein